MSGGWSAFPLVLVRSVKLVPWWHLGLGVVVALALAATRRTTYGDDVVFGLRVGAVALATSTTFFFDDPALTLMDAKPVSLLLQRLARLTVVLFASAAAWWLLVIFMESGLGEVGERTPASVPRVAMSVEFAALAGIVWAAGTLAQRSRGRAGGITGAATLLAIVVALLLLPQRWALFVSPGVPPGLGEVPSARWETWVHAHHRWAALAGLAWAGVFFGLRGSEAQRPTRRLALLARGGRGRL